MPALLAEALVAGEGGDGEVEAVEVVVEVEDFGEAGAGVGVFFPVAVGELVVDEPSDGFGDVGVGGGEGAGGGHEGHGAPGGLGGGAGAAAFEVGVFVGVAGFAEGAVGFLDGAEPVDGFAYPLVVHAFADAAETGEGLPCAIDVVDAPAAEPAAILVLRLLDEVDGFADGGVGGGDAAVAEAFEDAAGDVGAGGILDGVVVGEGDVFEDGAVAGAVEGGPAAIIILHGEEPVDGAFDGGLRGSAAGALEGHRHHGGVVDVGVVGVGVFEEPAGGFDVGGVFGPVGGGAAFFGEEPVDGGGGDGGVFGEAGFGEGVEGDAGVPDGGEAGLDADVWGVGGTVGGGGAGGAFLGIVGGVVGVVDEEVFEMLLGFEDGGVVVRVTEGTEDDEYVDHRGEDGAEAFGVLHVVEDPFFGFAHGAGSERGDGGFLEALEGEVEEEEHFAPGFGEIFEGAFG